MIVLTRRFNSVAVGDICVQLVGEVAVWERARCVSRYLTKRGLKPSTRPVSPPAVVYTAAGRPKKLVVNSHVEVEDGLDLFSGFEKRGMWREVAPSFYAVLADYVSRRHFYTMRIDVAGDFATSEVKKPGFYMSVERAGGTWRVTIAAAPGMGQAFKEAAAAVFDKATAVRNMALGTPVDVPLDVYLLYEKSTYSSPQRTTKPLLLTFATSVTP